MSPNVFIEVGSNLDPEANIPAGLSELTRLGKIVKISTAYENPAVGPPDQPDFVNLAVLLRTELSPGELRAGLREIEAKQGRVRSPDRFAPREIDLDISLYGSLILGGTDFSYPDPEILKRVYLAQTLAELDPNFVHPLTGETLSQIAEKTRSAQNSLTPRPDITAAVENALRPEDKRA